jgi:hypothetical protein
MASNCYMSVFIQKANAVGFCIQQSVQHVVHAPRLASAEEWSTTLISAGLALVCAIAILSVFLALENSKPNTRRRFT